MPGRHSFKAKVFALAAGLTFALALAWSHDPALAATNALLLGGIVWLRMG